jgi:hypothetical protein
VVTFRRVEKQQRWTGRWNGWQRRWGNTALSGSYSLHSVTTWMKDLSPESHWTTLCRVFPSTNGLEFLIQLPACQFLEYDFIQSAFLRHIPLTPI